MRFQMSPRCTSYLPLSPLGSKTVVFHLKLYFAWKSLLQGFFVWKLSVTKLYSIHWPIYPCKNDWWGTSPCTWKSGEYLPTPLHNTDFLSIFACSTSAVPPSNIVQLTLIGSPLRTFPSTKVRCLAVTRGPWDCSYSIFARSASAVTANEKSSTDTNGKSTACFPMNLRRIVYIDPKPRRGL